jgi:hypothetical protein
MIKALKVMPVAVFVATASERPALAQFGGALSAGLLIASLLAFCCVASGQAHAANIESETLADDAILALDPERISDRQVKDVLSKAPAPEILTFKGTLLADMESFGRFISAMGYPTARIHTYDVTWRGCTCVECAEILGTMAWYYEQEGMVPMMVGHSGGGVVVSRILYGLANADGAGTDRRQIPVWNPVKKQAESRYAMHDPVTGQTRRFSDLRVPYAAMLATGQLLRKFPGFPGCGEDVERLLKIPDTVQEFTGFQIEGDVFTAGTGPYQSVATAAVRNVTLSIATSHINAFRMDGLAQDADTRAWISAYRPSPALDPKSVPDASNITQAADIWYSIKKHWCTEAQRLIEARRAPTR